MVWWSWRCAHPFTVSTALLRKSVDSTAAGPDWATHFPFPWPRTMMIMMMMKRHGGPDTLYKALRRVYI